MKSNIWKNILDIFSIFILLFVSILNDAHGQSILRGLLLDSKSGEPLIGATVLIKGTLQGGVTDYEGNFILRSDKPLPLTLEFRYGGYATKEFIYTTNNKYEKILLEEESIQIEAVEITGFRISDKQKTSPLTVESMDLMAIKETPAANFYSGLGSLKDVDLTTASLGFTIINTRGFNSTNPVRTLQLIDGVDNQSPGLNFSLGNFLGASELDVLKVDLIVGASSAFYGPNAFNGVINMETKSPFFHKGVSSYFKMGERNLFEGGVRWADVFKNKAGKEKFGLKFNFSFFRANDWEADNTDPVFDTQTGRNNPGGYDAVNVYGDEFLPEFDYRRSLITYPGLNIFHRKGYREKDVVDYNSYNLKSNFAFHWRLRPSRGYESPELIAASSFGGGTTVFQGDNRFSLKNIKFFQHRLELRKQDHYFLRIYGTHEDAGDSYDPYFTALQLQQRATNTFNWVTAYSNYWTINVAPRIRAMEGYPKVSDYLGRPDEFRAAIDQFTLGITDSLFIWHALAQDYSNTANTQLKTSNFFKPGTAEFDSVFSLITSRISGSEGGTRFYDRSALIHSQGEYIFKNLYSGDFLNNISLTTGYSGRYYRPDSRGSILLDTGGNRIDTWEWGIYLGPTFTMLDNTLKLNLTSRLDKNKNFDYLFSPAASLVYQPNQKDFYRVSFSSAIRNPTLTDQFLNYNVGRAILRGNLEGVENLITLESFVDFLNSGQKDTIQYFNIPPIRPEQVRTIELGYRTTLWKRLFVDMGYYFSRYKNFIGYQLGIDAFIPTGSALPTSVQAYRISSNARDIVTSQGFSIGLNYFFGEHYVFKGNYSWNVLNTQSDDPIIPAFNTPEHKYNVGITGRDLKVFGIKNLGFSVNYKWIDGFIFEGSPQFTGFIPDYNLTDVQVNWAWVKRDLTFKAGASNVFNQKSYQTYGGPLIGRLAYFSVLYEFKK